MKELKKRLIAVINNIDDGQILEDLALCIEDFLNDIHEQDGFGTEGQCDPRGDFRDGDNWSVFNVQGIDKN